VEDNTNPMFLDQALLPAVSMTSSGESPEVSPSMHKLHYAQATPRSFGDCGSMQGIASA
jgi:hypothetical protein